MTTTETPATTKIATCYDPSAAPGSRTLVAISRDNTSHEANRVGRYLVTKIWHGNADGHWRQKTEEQAIAYAADLGYTEVVREEVR